MLSPQKEKKSKMENKKKEVKRQSAKAKRGLWKPEEDLILKDYVETHGEGNWATLSKKSGLRRGGKSCRLRWKNYLRPNIKRGGMSQQEEDLIIRMHKLLGNRWSLIAGRLPGRTDNEVKNYWNTHLNKKCRLGKRKATDIASSDCSVVDSSNTSNNKLKLPRMCDSYNINKNTSQGSEGEEYNGGSFNYDIDSALTPLRNAKSVFDDDSFIAYLDSFLALECNQ